MSSTLVGKFFTAEPQGKPDAYYHLENSRPDAGRDWGQEEKGTTEDEMAGWHH